MALCGGTVRAWAAPAATTTTLAVASGGNTVTTVASSSVVTLTATVKTGTTAVTTGQVNFCDASAAHCTDIHLLGTRQLTSTGTAVLKFIPGAGSHSYKAVFLGTTSNATSTSSDASLTVTASVKYSTTTTIAQSGSAGSYTLTATVTGTGGLEYPTGTVSFLDTSSGNAVLGTAALETGTAGISFLNSSNTATAIYPQSVAVGDFNGDGIPDLAVGNLQGEGVTILLGNGDGTFTAAASLEPGNYESTSVAVGDFNGDGKTDLAVTKGYGNDSVSIFLGNGDGTFTLQSTPRTGKNPVAIAVGDFNGDGIPDLAVADQQEVSNGLTILLGNGDGTFTAAASPQTGSLPNSVAVGDFNGDGIPDLVVDNGGNTVTILLGKGDGTFTAKSLSVATGGGVLPEAVAVGDFNGDGKADLALTNGAFDTVTVLLGNGDGTFTAAASPETGSYPSFIAIGDFNGDGKADLAVANGDDTVTVLLGKVIELSDGRHWTNNGGVGGL
jgi:hypothetical protein